MQEHKSPADPEKADQSTQTLKDSGWRLSRYNLFARIPGTNMHAGVNLYKGICASYSVPEMYLYSEAENLPAAHPILGRFRERGLITNHDEREALFAAGRLSTAFGGTVNLTVAPTMGCNFDCPYCFEEHRPGKMSAKVQNEIAALAERMLKASGAKSLHVTWYGGRAAAGNGRCGGAVGKAFDCFRSIRRVLSGVHYYQRVSSGSENGGASGARACLRDADHAGRNAKDA